MTYSHPAHRGKRDMNAALIAEALRRAGCSVVDLGTMGDGVPDLLVGCQGSTYLIEVKSPDSRPHRAKGAVSGVTYGEYLTDDQIAFLSSWRGCPVRIVTTSEEALAEVGKKNESAASAAGGTKDA